MQKHCGKRKFGFERSIYKWACNLSSSWHSTKTVVPVAKVDITFYSSYLTGKYNIWCMDNPVFDLIFGKVSEARKPYDPYPEWEAVLALGTRQQRIEEALPHPFHKVYWHCGWRYSTRWQLQRTRAWPNLICYMRERIGAQDIPRWKITWFSRNRLMCREFKGDKTYIQLIVPLIYRNAVMRLAHESSCQDTWLPVRLLTESHRISISLEWNEK